MNAVVMWVYAVACLGVALFAAWHSLRGFQFSNLLFWSLGALELALVALAIGSGIALAHTDRDVSVVLFVSYLVTCLVIPPAAVLWGIAEKSRWGTGVVAVAMVTVAVLVVRLEQIWRTGV